jgi:diguanylate cyclase (GGDEF)-like protein
VGWSGCVVRLCSPGRMFVMRRFRPSRKALLLVLCPACVIAVGVADYASGAELSLSIFYLFPVGIAAWYVGGKTGIVTSIESALCWYAADVLARIEPYPSPLIPAWNAGVRLVTFLTVTVLLTILRTNLDRQSLFARMDYLTGAANSRYLYEAIAGRISLLQRKERLFSLLYVDVDDFKEVNDVLGHAAGDRALQEIAATMRQTVRPADIVGRVGGDEFLIVLPEADARAAEVVSSRIRSALRQGPGRQYRLTCSIGALTCLSVPGSVDEAVAGADDLMYQAKRNGKNAVASGSI